MKLEERGAREPETRPPLAAVNVLCSDGAVHSSWKSDNLSVPGNWGESYRGGLCQRELAICLLRASISSMQKHIQIGSREYRFTISILITMGCSICSLEPCVQQPSMAHSPPIDPSFLKVIAPLPCEGQQVTAQEPVRQGSGHSANRL